MSNRDPYSDLGLLESAFPSFVTAWLMKQVMQS